MLRKGNGIGRDEQHAIIKQKVPSGGMRARKIRVAAEDFHARTAQEPEHEKL